MLWLVLGLLLLVARPSPAATIAAASCAPADVQAAITAAASGDTVHLPTCTYNGFNTTVTITKPLILEGNGTATTVLNRTGGSLVMLEVSNVTGFVLRHLTLDGSQNDAIGAEDVGLKLLSCVDFRIHDVALRNLSQGIWVEGDATVQRGVIHANTFTNVWLSYLGYGVVVYGNGTYPALTLGTAQNVFIENNTFTGSRHTVSANNGSRYVFRHNTILDNREDAAAIDNHGKTFHPRGGRQYEIYGNTIDNSVARFAGIGIRGGDGVIFDNVLDTNITQKIQLQDENCSGTYPVLDQIRDLYLWNNTLIGGGTAPIVNGCTSLLQQDRDYFLSVRGGYTPYTYPHPATLASTPPTVSITAPTSATTFSTSTTPLTTLAGTASDDVGVTSITWACPTCTPTSGTATCATCGAAGTDVTWSVASIGLASGANVLTMTANDADTQTGQDVLTVTYTPPVVSTTTPVAPGFSGFWAR